MKMIRCDFDIVFENEERFKSTICNPIWICIKKVIIMIFIIIAAWESTRHRWPRVSLWGLSGMSRHRWGSQCTLWSSQSSVQSTLQSTGSMRGAGHRRWVMCSHGTVGTRRWGRRRSHKMTLQLLMVGIHSRWLRTGHHRRLGGTLSHS